VKAEALFGFKVAHAANNCNFIKNLTKNFWRIDEH